MTHITGRNPMASDAFAEQFPLTVRCARQHNAYDKFERPRALDYRDGARTVDEVVPPL